MSKMRKRGVTSITAFVDAAALVKNVVKLEANLRDKALLSTLILTGLRISEILSIRRDNIRIQGDHEFVVIRGVHILKRRKDHILKDIPLPKRGFFKPLTDYILRYLSTLPKRQEMMFNISRQRCWQIVKALTGKWNHYYRSMRISHLINERGMSGVAVAKLLGIKQSSTIDHYDKSSWKNHRERLQ